MLSTMAASPGVVLTEAVQNATKHKPRTDTHTGVVVAEGAANAATNSTY